MPHQEQSQELFEAIATDSPRLRHLLATRLYVRPEQWFDIRNEAGDTLLLAAARHGLGGVVEMLVSKGFSADAWNSRIQTALHLAKDPDITRNVIRASTSRIALALEADASGDLPLHVQLRRGDVETAKCLLNCANATAQVLRPNAQGETPLFEASRSLPQLVVPLLLLGADPRIRNAHGQAPVELCRDKDVQAKLRAFSAHLDRQDEYLRQQAQSASDDKLRSRRTLSLAQQARQFLGSTTQPSMTDSFQRAP